MDDSKSFMNLNEFNEFKALIENKNFNDRLKELFVYISIWIKNKYEVTNLLDQLPKSFYMPLLKSICFEYSKIRNIITDERMIRWLDNKNIKSLSFSTLPYIYLLPTINVRIPQNFNNPSKRKYHPQILEIKENSKEIEEIISLFTIQKYKTIITNDQWLILKQDNIDFNNIITVSICFDIVYLVKADGLYLVCNKYNGNPIPMNIGSITDFIFEVIPELYNYYKEIIDKINDHSLEKFNWNIIGLEYNELMLTNKLIDIIGRNSYEGSNILERYLISISTAEYIYNPEYKEITVKELVDKKIVTNYNKGKEMMDKIIQTIKKYIYSKFYKTTCEDDYIICGNFRFKINERISYLLKRFNCRDVVKCLLKYQAIISKGQQWGLIKEHFVELYKIGVRNEGFASPFNSRFLELGIDIKFCSLFNVDKVFGSAGNFFEQKLEGKWQINPPFIEEILNKTSKKVLSEMKNDLDVFFLLPYWTDLTAYIDLDKSEYKRYKLILKKNTYKFDTPERINASVTLVYFYLSSRKDDDYTAKVIECFNKIIS